MGRLKGCFNETCMANRKRIKYNDTNDFCSKCGDKLEYVCKDRKCYTLLVDVFNKYCDGCITERINRKEVAKTRFLKVTKSVPTVVVSVAAITSTMVGVKKDVSDILPKKK